MLKGLQEKLIELLGEVAAVCEKHKIPYCASERLLWDAFSAQGWQDANLEVVLIMYGKDIKRFKRKARRLLRSARQIETSKENPTLAPGAIRYVASDTTCIDLRSPLVQKPGLAITVKPVWKTTTGVEYAFDAHTVINIKGDPLQSLEQGSFCGASLPLVSASQRSFWKKVMGAANATKCTIPTLEYKRGVIADECIPYEDYLAAAGHGRIAALCKANEEYADWRAADYATARKAVDASVPVLRMITQRFRCCEEYLPQKEALLVAWRQGCKDEVAEALASYTRYLKMLYRSGLTVYFDEELFDLAVDVLRYQAWPHAEKLKALVPQRHKEQDLAARLAPFVLEQ